MILCVFNKIGNLSFDQFNKVSGMDLGGRAEACVTKALLIINNATAETPVTTFFYSTDRAG